MKADKTDPLYETFGNHRPGIARQGYPIEDAEGNEIGVVCSGTVSPLTGKSIGTGYVKSGFHKLDSEIFIRVRNKGVESKIVKTPFSDTGNSNTEKLSQSHYFDFGISVS